MPKTEKLFEDAVSLPVEDRIKLIEKLLESTNPPEKEIDEWWVKEAEKRVQELDKGDVIPVPGEEVFEKVKKRFK
jgi:putative addiction module component (TIGR02574 family)